MNRNTAFLITIGLIGFLSSNVQATGGDIFTTSGKRGCKTDADCNQETEFCDGRVCATKITEKR